MVIGEISPVVGSSALYSPVRMEAGSGSPRFQLASGARKSATVSFGSRKFIHLSILGMVDICSPQLKKSVYFRNGLPAVISPFTFLAANGGRSRNISSA